MRDWEIIIVGETAYGHKRSTRRAGVLHTPPDPRLGAHGLRRTSDIIGTRRLCDSGP